MLEQDKDQTPGTDIPFDDSELRRALASGANWFYWIAALSLVKSVISLCEGKWNFAVGLGITQIIDAIGQVGMQNGGGNWIKIVLFTIDLIIAGTFFVFGVFANRRYSWAFLTGMILYLLDGLIMVVAGDVLGIIIHALALYFLFRGFMASRELNRLGTSVL
jgi:hypothetical protein